MTDLSRRLLLGAATTLAMPAIRSRAAGKTLRMGFQKGEPVLMAAKQNQDLEKLLAPLGWGVEWIEFQFGPPMLEAMRVGSIDIGAVGDTPPVFAQAAHGDLLYVAGLRSGAQAILLPAGSPIGALADLKGKKLAFGRGSSAHNFTIKALEKAGLRYDQIESILLGPADAGAAFSHGAIEAWSIWDPYYALFENRPGVRTLVTNDDLGEQNSFIMGWAPFVRSNADLTAKLVDRFAESSAWVRSNRPQVAELLAGTTGMPLDVMQRVIARVPAEVLPMTPDIIQSQQRVAERFRALGLLPVDITVAEIVWHANA
jgi:aliphatic sulfonates family ABC transporter substrate-binding protein